MGKWKRLGLFLGIVLTMMTTVGCDGVKLKFTRYAETPIVAAPPAGLSSSELAAIIVAIR